MTESINIRDHQGDGAFGGAKYTLSLTQPSTLRKATKDGSPQGEGFGIFGSAALGINVFFQVHGAAAGMMMCWWKIWTCPMQLRAR